MDDFKFDKNNTFCISLYSRPDRWESMKTRFKILNLDVTRWKASTPDDLTDNFIDHLKEVQKACTQSHVNIWKHIVDNNIKYAFILEDDALFDKNWRYQLSKFNREIEDPDWNIILLNASEPLEILDKWITASEQFLTGGYIMSLMGAKAILEIYKECFHMCDWMTSRLQYKNHCYCYFPWPIIQEGIDSTIGSGVDEDHKKVVRCLKEIGYSLDNYVTGFGRVNHIIYI